MQHDRPSEQFSFEMLDRFLQEMQTRPAERFTLQRLETIRSTVLTCKLMAKSNAQKQLIRRGCFWWNELATYWNGTDKMEKLELIQLKSDPKSETTALTIRSKPELLLTDADRKFLKQLKITWDDDNPA